MKIILGILVGIAWLLIVAFLRSLTTLFHEFGHALPSLFFTDKNVNVFIGTHGDTHNCLHMGFGRLHVYFRFNIFNWNIGMCTHVGVPEVWKNIIIVIAGPLASTMIAMPILYIISQGGLHQAWLFVLMAFVISAFIDLCVNLYPSSQAIYTQGGSTTYNDGYSLYLLISRFFLPQSYLDLEHELEKGNYDEFFNKGAALLEKGNVSKNIYQLMIHACMEEKEYNDAIFLYGKMGQKYKLIPNDHFEIGKIKQKLNRHGEAISYFDQYIYYNYYDPAALTFRGISKIAIGENKEAIRDFDASIYNNPHHLETYVYRGLAYTKLKDYENAESDFNIAKQAEPNHPRLIFHLGIFHENQKEYKNALDYYLQAKELGIPNSELIEKIIRLENMLG